MFLLAFRFRFKQKKGMSSEVPEYELGSESELPVLGVDFDDTFILWPEYFQSEESQSENEQFFSPKVRRRESSVPLMGSGLSEKSVSGPSVSMKEVVYQINKNPKKGIAYAIESSAVGNTPEEIAKFLYQFSFLL